MSYYHNNSYAHAHHAGDYVSGSYSNHSSAQLSSQALSSIDQNLLQHENPNNCTDLAPALPLDQYKLNVDNNPHIIRKKPSEKLHFQQEIAVRYLKPPAAPRGGDIVIKQMPSRQVAPAPPLIVRQPGQKAPSPPPCVIREAPPQPPAPLPGKTITIPGKVIPPPARKVIVEKLPGEPAKPQNVLIERWLPYGPQTQRIIYQPAQAPCIIPDPRNVVIQWENPDVEVKRELKNLGVHAADPRDYVARYGSSLIRSDQLPELVVKYSSQQGVQLAANHSSHDGPLLEGDVQALRLIDLDSHGLGYLRSRIGSVGGPIAASESLYSASEQHFSSHSAAASASSPSATYYNHNSNAHAHSSGPAYTDLTSASVQSYESTSLATGERFC